MGTITKENLFNQKGKDYYKNILVFLQMFKDIKMELKHLRSRLVKYDKNLISSKKKRFDKHLKVDFEDIINNQLFSKMHQFKWIRFKEYKVKKKDNSEHIEWVTFSPEIDSNKLLNYYLNQLAKLELIYKVYYLEDSGEIDVESPAYMITEEGENLLWNELSHFVIDKMYAENKVKEFLNFLLFGKDIKLIPERMFL